MPGDTPPALYPMPFTPFHLGPGIFGKSIATSWFSFTIFGLSQVIIDLEPLIRMLAKDSLLHGFTHSYAGATLLLFPTVVLGKPLCEGLLRYWNRYFTGWAAKWLQVAPQISLRVSLFSAALGLYSHVLLDSMMHADMQPWQPFSTSNALLGLLPIPWIYLLCAVVGVVGGMILLTVYFWRRWSIEVP